MGVKVSIIMPSLNVAPYIRQCLESVINQTLRDIEILCIDAGSTDGTREILEEYADRDVRIHLVDSPVKSYGYQVNLGIDAAHGKYVGIVETDDFVAADMFAYLYRLAEKYDVDVAHADRYFVQDSNVLVASHIFTEKNHDKYLQKIDNTSFLSAHLQDISVWDALYRREFLWKRHIRCNESSGAAYQDIGFLQQVHTLAQSFVYSDQPLYYYRVDRSDSSTNRPGWLRYVRQEWQFILGNGLMDQSEWKLHRGVVLARLVQSFLVELERSLKIGQPQSEWWQDAEWLREHAYEAVKQGRLAEEYLSREERQRLYLILHSMDCYMGYVQAVCNLDQHNEAALLHWAESGALIFGAGIRGRKAMAFLRQHGGKIFGFSDNNAHLWGTMIDGVPVIAPKEIRHHIEDGMVIICNKLYWEDILDQLHKLGIPSKKIRVYNP